MRESGRNIDTEHEVLTRLTELRQAISTHVASARQASEVSGDVGALRAAIGLVFDSVFVRPAEHPITCIEGYDESAEPIEGGAYWIEPHLREDAIVLAQEEEEGAGRAILRQVPLEMAGINYAGTGVPE